MNKPNVSNPRIYDLARANNVASRYILRVLELGNPGKYSASSQVEVTVDTQIFWNTVIDLALVNQDIEEQKSISRSQN